MTLVRVNPGRKIRRSHRPFDHLFNEFMHPRAKQTSNGSITRRPLVNVLEGKESFRIELAAPGLVKEDFKIDLDKDVLTIETSTKIDQQEKFLRREFNYGTFKRSFQLNEQIDTEGINAEYKNGVLKITLAKKEEAKEQEPRVIEIS